MKKKRIAGLFVQGPIPLDWLNACGKLSGQCLHLGIHLWWLDGLHHGKAPYRIRPSNLYNLGVNRYSYYRALKKMQSAGLIKYRARPGKAARVTILKIDTGTPNSTGKNTTSAGISLVEEK